MSVYSVLSAGSGDAANIKAGNGWVQAIYLSNLNAAARYVKLYDKATAPSGSDTPLLRLLVPGGATTVGGVADLAFPENAVNFGTGLGVRIVTGSADSDNTGVAAGDVIVNVVYR